MPDDVFISYSSNDQDRVVKLADRLRSAGVSIWVDESGIGAATLWSKEIAGAIKGCKVLVLMVTPNSVKSKNVVKEVSLAAEQNKQILPVILEPTKIPESLEYHLAGIQHLDVSGMSASESAEEILPALRRLLGTESDGVPTAAHGPRGGRRRSSNIWAEWRLYGFGVMTSAVALVLGWYLKPTPQIPPVLEPHAPPAFHVKVILAGDSPLLTEYGCPFALSKDGRNLVYVTGDPAEGKSHLHLHRLSDGTDKELEGTEGAYNPFFSPDGQSIGFVTITELRTVPLSGGTPRNLASVSQSRGGAWGKDGNIVYAPNSFSGLKKVSASGGDSTELTKLEEGEYAHCWPQFLPDGRHVLFTAQGVSVHIKVVDVTGGPPKSVLPGGTFARYVKSGHLLYVNSGILHAAPFDPTKLEVTGRSAQMRQVESNSEGGAPYAVAEEAGTLVYLPGKGVTERNNRLVWSDEQGNITPVSVGKKGAYYSPDISPDDQHVALDLDGDIHVLDIERGTLRRLTVDEGIDSVPLWSPDGEWIVFSSSRGGKPGLWRRRTDWSTDAEMILEHEKSPPFPMSFSADGKILVYERQMQETGWDTWVYRMEEDNAEPESVLDTKFFEAWPTISPDGGSIAYQSDEGGRMDIYLSSLDSSGGVQMVSTTGGWRPRWSTDGGRLFYSGNGAIWSVEIIAEGGTYKLSSPEKIIEMPPDAHQVHWDFTSDGKRFLFSVNETGDDSETATPEGPNTVNIIFNFFTELNEKVPLGKE